MSYGGRGYHNSNGRGGGQQRNDLFSRIGVNSNSGSPSRSGNSGFGGGFSNDNRDMTVLEIRGWQGGSREDLVSFISRKCGVVITDLNQVDNEILTAKVRSDKLKVVERLSGIRFAGNVLKLQAINGPVASNSSVEQTVSILKQFFHSRYRSNERMLDLTAIQHDQFLISHGLFASASTSSKMFPALMKIAANEKGCPVDTVNLASNGLKDLTTITSLAQTYPNLQNLSLMDNQISRLNALDLWRHKFRNLRQLILTMNPVVQVPGYKAEMLKMFPKLVVLDGEIVRNEEELQKALTFPLLAKDMFFQDDEIKGMATNFLANYFQFFDNNRQDLLQLYNDQSQFSLSIDSVAPHEPLSEAGSSSGAPTTSQSFSMMLPLSRNLLRITSPSGRASKLARGPQEVAQLFNKLPSTTHELVTHPEQFAIEAWRLDAVGAVMISVHGEFLEKRDVSVPSGPRHSRLNKNQADNVPVKRSLDRTFMIAPNTNGSILILSDMLVVRPYAGTRAWRIADPISAAGSAVASAVPSVSTSPAPAAGPGGLPVIGSKVSNEVIALQLEALRKAYPSVNFTEMQMNVVGQLIAATGMNAEFANMCANENSYNYEQSLMAFNNLNSTGAIPANAFISG